MTDSITARIGEKIFRVFGAGVTLGSLVPLAGDASSRRYYRAHLTGSDDPRSLIIMELPGGSALPLSSEELAIFKEGPAELPFLNLHRFLTAIGVAVPHLYGQWETEGLLMLEDLGDTALWDRVQGAADPEVMSWYERAIDELLRLQLRGTAARDPRCIAFQQRFDLKLYLWEFDHFIDWGLLKRPDAKVVATTLKRLKKVFARIAETLDRQPAYLSHRDYHSWNLMVHNDAIRVIDFQDALLAPLQYDLASLLNDRITDRVVKPPLEDRLVRYYFERKCELENRRDDFAQFQEIYRLSAIQRDFKVIGRFYYLNLVKGKPGYMRYVPPTARRLKRNLALTAQTEAIVPLLADHFEAML